MRQTEICHSLTVPPFRRPYNDPVWESLWPPFHFNCRTTVRAIYDEAEIEDAGGPNKFYSQGTPDYKPDKGFGAYPVDKTDKWWDLTDAMRDRATLYDLDKEFEEAKEKLVEPQKDSTNKTNGFIIDEEKVAETLHKVEMTIKDIEDHEEAYVIGLDGKIIRHIKGIEHEVNVPPELTKGNIVTHNHPSGGCALSIGDVKDYIKNDGYGIRAVTSDGRYVYLRKGEGKLNKELVNDFEKEVPSGTKLILKGGEQAMRKYGPKATNYQRFREAENIVNKWLFDNAHKYGYIYTQGGIISG